MTAKRNGDLCMDGQSPLGDRYVGLEAALLNLKEIRRDIGKMSDKQDSMRDQLHDLELRLAAVEKDLTPVVEERKKDRERLRDTVIKSILAGILALLLLGVGAFVAKSQSPKTVIQQDLSPVSD